MSRRILKAAILLSFISTVGNAQDDITILDEITVKAPAQKEEGPAAEKAASATSMGSQKLDNAQVTSVKDLSLMVPNLLNPNYGSRTTSALYIRGIGSRMDQPSVGLYVDGIPYFNKSTFDFNFSEIERVMVLRGPQGTLYGRNTMAGIIDIRTTLPDTFSAHTSIDLGYGTYNKLDVHASHFNHIGKVGVGLAGYWEQNDGYFTNSFSGKKIDDDKSGGLKLSLNYHHNRFGMLLTAAYDHSQQNGYPYARIDTANTGTSGKSVISYNRDCTYERDLLTTGLSLEYAWPGVILSSATSFQYLNDEMRLDNDFTEANYFTLGQLQKERSLSEEIILKTNLRDGAFRHYSFLTGANVFRKDLEINAPVNMLNDGIGKYVEDNVNKVPILQQMGMSLDITNDHLEIGTKADYPATGAALFHQSTYRFNEQWSVIAGIRADYERTEFDYNSHLVTNYVFTPMIPKEQSVATNMDEKISQDYWEWMPKLAIKYQWEKGRNAKIAYASVAKGYKSGGYNSQMMSDLLQYQMQKDVKEDMYGRVPDYVPVKESIIKPILMNMSEINAKEVLEYKPEYSWNYEVGTHLAFDSKLTLDAAVFFIDYKDQQVTVFSQYSEMGRMMKNAGHTQSYGAELSASYDATQWLNLNGSFGYTHAEYKDYQANDSVNYKGNNVPYAPKYTYSIGILLHKNMNGKAGIGNSSLSLNWNGAGDIYWTDDNTERQSHYGLLNAKLSVSPYKFNKLTISVWGKNITDSDYNTFYFETFGNRFVQKGKPVEAGVSVKLKF